jgi:hypothetical protein
MILAVLAGTLPQPAYAQFRTREFLLAECSATTGDPQVEVKRVACYAYMSGVLDTADLHDKWGKEPLRFCLPEGITPALLRDHVISYIRENPDLEGTPGSFNVLMAAATKFPCKAKPEKKAGG